MRRLPAPTLGLPLSLVLALASCLTATGPAADGRGQQPVFSNGSQADTSRSPVQNSTSTEGPATRPSTITRHESDWLVRENDDDDYIMELLATEEEEEKEELFERLDPLAHRLHRPLPLKTTAPTHQHTHRRLPVRPREFPDWSEFCREAAVEEDEPVFVNDGSLNPRFEEVPGVGVYRFHARARTWAEARKVCELEGATLAVPNSREEALALADIHNRCRRLLSSHFNDYQYVGVHDDFKEGRWETISGYPLNETGYENWARNQPDNAHFRGENCLCMNRNTFYNDVPCWTELPFICEHP